MVQQEIILGFFSFCYANSTSNPNNSVHKDLSCIRGQRYLLSSMYAAFNQLSYLGDPIILHKLNEPVLLKYSSSYNCTLSMSGRKFIFLSLQLKAMKAHKGAIKN